MIPDAEMVIGNWLRSHASVTALDARVGGRTPSNPSRPWVRVTQLDAPSHPDDPADWLIPFMVQLDCYAGDRADGAQAEANLLARSVRAALVEIQGVRDGVSVSRARFVGMLRNPDQDMEPARERVILTAIVPMHG